MILRLIGIAATAIAITSSGSALGAQGTPNPKQVVDLCSLYTAQELQKLSGEQYGKALVRNNQMSDVTGSTCWYRGDQFSLDMNVERGRTADGVNKMVSTLRKTATGTTGKAPENLKIAGHEAFYGQISATSGMLNVIVGTDFFSFRTYGRGKGAGTLEKTREIADVVIPRYKAKYPAGK